MRAVSPGSLSEALELLAAEPDLRLVAGCTDLMVTDPLARRSMDRVLNLLTVPELQGLRETEGYLEIGATTTFTTLGASAVVRERFHALARAAGVIGGWQIQNRATLGGNLVNASPAGDSPPALLALGATVLCQGPEGAREVPYHQFHTGYRETALRRGEILTAVHLPWPSPGSRQLYRKVGTREAQAISKVVVSLWARLEEGRVAEARFGAGSVAATPVRLTAAEGVLLGQRPDAETAERTGRAAASEVRPIDDVRSTARYRSWALARVVRRMVLELAETPSAAAAGG